MDPNDLSLVQRGAQAIGGANTGFNPDAIQRYLDYTRPIPGSAPTVPSNAFSPSPAPSGGNIIDAIGKFFQGVFDNGANPGANNDPSNGANNTGGGFGGNNGPSPAGDESPTATLGEPQGGIYLGPKNLSYVVEISRKGYGFVTYRDGLWYAPIGALSQQPRGDQYGQQNNASLGDSLQQTGQALGDAVQTALDDISSFFNSLGDQLQRLAMSQDSTQSAPVILDLSGNGVKITQKDSSNVFFDMAGDGYQHLTAWAGAGNAVLAFDANNDGKIDQQNEIVFTQWDPTATSDLQALRDVFDTNHDGKLDASDAKFSQFKLIVTNADGTQTVETLAQAGVASINLIANQVTRGFADGSSIDGQTSFTRTNGTTGTAAAVTFAYDAAGHALQTTTTHNADGSTTIDNKALNPDGSLANERILTTSADGKTKTLSVDLNGDGVIDQIQTDVTVTNADGSTTQTVTDKNAAGVASINLIADLAPRGFAGRPSAARQETRSGARGRRSMAAAREQSRFSRNAGLSSASARIKQA